ncbi:hypothetical protein ACIQGZ_18125 [Streptomyces sp. NPDC092296]|uniref:hypothetical protein n=1 Tax=Streptomyces sp. NPDC092296 TaxID=3366012 RepID=UPI00380A7AC9
MTAPAPDGPCRTSSRATPGYGRRPAPHRSPRPAAVRHPFPAVRRRPTAVRGAPAVRRNLDAAAAQVRAFRELTEVPK